MKSIQGKIDQVLVVFIISVSALILFSVERLIVNERKVRHEELAMTSADLLVQDLQDKNKISRDVIASLLSNLSSVRVAIWITGKGIKPILPADNASKAMLSPILLEKANYTGLNPKMPEYFEHNKVTYFTCAMVLPPSIRLSNTSEPLTIRFLENTSRTPLSSWSASTQLISIIAAGSGIALLVMRSSLTFALKPLKQLQHSMQSVDMQGKEISHNEMISFDGYPFELHSVIKEYNKLIDRISEQHKNTRFFISSISHELTTPFTIILGCVRGIRKQDLSSSDELLINEYLNSIQTSSDDSLVTLNNLTVLARADNRSLKTSIISFSASSFLQDLCNSHSELHNLDNKFPLVHLIRNDRAMISSDRAILRNSIYSIIENAQKYAPDERGVEIYGYKSIDSSHYIVDIRDFGQGIPIDMREKIFERFARAQSVLNQKSGSGLGLAVVKETLSLIGASIEAPHNPYGPGGLFRIQIRLSDSA